MKYILSLLVIAVIALLVIILDPMDGKNGPNRKPYTLDYVLNHADDLDGKLIRVRGRVKAKAGIIGKGGYILEDGGKTVLIFSTKGIPAIGDTYVVTGTFRQAFEFRRSSYSVITEDYRKRK